MKMRIETEADMQYVLQNMADRIIILENKIKKIEEMRTHENASPHLKAAEGLMRGLYD